MKKLQSQKETKKSSRNNDPYAHIPKKYKGGHCYSNAYHFLLYHKNPNLRLVHGWVTSQMPEIKGIRYSHAWIENIKIHTVIDPSANIDNPLIIADFLYYHIGNVNADRLNKYTLQEALEQAVSKGTFGPWDTTFDEFPKV